MHRRLLVLVPELHLADAGRLEDPAAALHVRVHLHARLVDGGVHHHPRAAAQLAVGGDVHEDGVAVDAQLVHDHRAELENLAVHVARAAREPAPVGEDDQRQVLRVVEVANRRRRLVRAVREPHLPGLRQHRLARLGVGGVRGDALLHQTRLHGDHTHGHAPQTRAPAHHGLAPVRERLRPRAFIEEPGGPLAVRAVDAGDHVPRVVRRLSGLELNLARHRIGAGQRGRAREAVLGDVGEPAQDGHDALLVILHLHVRHAVGHHHLRPAELVLRRVHVAAQQLVEREVAGEDERPVRHLDVPLPEAAQVRADAHGAPGDVRQRERVRVRRGLLAGDHPRTPQILHADAVNLADDVVQLHARLAILRHLLRVHRALGEVRVVLGGEVQILEPQAGVGGVVPRHLEVRLELLHQADARARVGRDVYARQTLLSRVLGDGVVKIILLHPERTGHERAVVAHEHHLSAIGVLRRLHEALPCHHADVVGARDAARLGAVQRAVGVQHQLLGAEHVAGHLALALDVGEKRAPLHDHRLLDQAEEVVNVRRADGARDRALLLQRAGHRVRLQEARLLLAVLAEHAKLRRLPGERVEVLAVHVNLQPLAGHGGGHDAHGHLHGRVGALRDAEADLDLVHLPRQQLRGVARDELQHLRLERRHGLVKRAVRLHGEEVDVDAPRGGALGAWVQAGEVQRLHRLGEHALDPPLRGVARVRNAS